MSRSASGVNIHFSGIPYLSVQDYVASLPTTSVDDDEAFKKKCKTITQQCREGILPTRPRRTDKDKYYINMVLLTKQAGEQKF